MSTGFIVIMLIGIIIFAYIQRNKDLSTRQENQKKAEEGEEQNTRDLNEVFLDNKGDKKVTALVKSYFPNDTLIIRSILSSAGIESYVDKDALSTLYPGIRGFSKQDSIIYIYESKFEEAKEIVVEYIDNVKKERVIRSNSKTRNIIEYAAGGIAVPSGANRELPELMEQEE